MRYHHETPSVYQSRYGEIYICNHPVYSRCTLYKIGKRGLGVIQQRFNPETKTTYWAEIDEWLTDEIYLHPSFRDFFDKYSGLPINRMYPTVTIRQIMWALRMKPLLRERWETYFDRKDI